MLHRISESIAVFLFDKSDKYPIDIYIYGIELMISSLIGTIIILFLGLVLNVIIESIIFMVSLSLIRLFCGGYHAKTYFKCNLIFVISFVFALFVAKKAIFFISLYYYYTLMGLFLLSFIIFLKFSPVDNENKRVPVEKMKTYKVISILILVVELSVTLLLPLLNINQIIIILPTILVVDIAIITEKNIFCEEK